MQSPNQPQEAIIMSPRDPPQANRWPAPIVRVPTPNLRLRAAIGIDANPGNGPQLYWLLKQPVHICLAVLGYLVRELKSVGLGIYRQLERTPVRFFGEWNLLDGEHDHDAAPNPEAARETV
ncbi:hypothetical protein FS837_010764, partial [Tulasnella sp. UAMH 9824]